MSPLVFKNRGGRIIRQIRYEENGVARWEIVPGLFLGGYATPPDMDDIEVVIDLTGTTPMDLFGKLYICWAIQDAPVLPDGDLLRDLARYVMWLVTDHKRVLVRCGAGLNRSALIVARALMTRGMRAETAIGLVREKRGPEALSNSTFVDWLKSEDVPHEG